jgi:8-oxo-dGTP pyrophosphatase MutT (NUDIX family)
MTGTRHYTASGVVLNDRDEVLLVHHNKIGVWLYPGGHIDPDEDPAEAVLREVAEETGIHAAILSEPAFRHPAVRSHPTPWAIIEMDVTDSRIGSHRHIDLIYVCRARGGDPIAQIHEVSAARWVPLTDVVTLPTPTEVPALITQAANWARTRPSGGQASSTES